jgi:hypothetical protein
VIYLAQSENIIQCFSCFLKKFSDWTWEQEIRRGVREDPKYITCRRYKRRTAKNGSIDKCNWYAEKINFYNARQTRNTFSAYCKPRVVERKEE